MRYRIHVASSNVWVRRLSGQARRRALRPEAPTHKPELATSWKTKAKAEAFLDEVIQEQALRDRDSGIASRDLRAIFVIETFEEETI